MSGVYLVGSGGSTTPLPHVRCGSEGRELQDLLAHNLDLIPGDQVDPEDPRRWILIRREMPVPDPSTGTDRWSVDFLLADQDAMPTFVECKRYNDTRSRREVVGQALEYAANGHHYWDHSTLRDHAEATARDAGTTLEETLRRLQPTGDPSPDDYFMQMETNLREAQLRIVFFLEEAPQELKSVVDFLNRQMERSEMLVVEARQYRTDDVWVVSPTLFGFTEAARQVKRAVSVTRKAGRRKWDLSQFTEELRLQLSEDQATAVLTFREACLASGCTVTWGTGTTAGSYSVRVPAIAAKSLVTVQTSGTLILNFPWLVAESGGPDPRILLADAVRTGLGIDVEPAEGADSPGYTALSPERWLPRASDFASVIGGMAAG